MEPHKDEFGIFQIKQEDYGPKYREDLFGQYRMYVEMADRISERRGTANNFFLTANTLLVSIFTAIVGKDALSANSSMNWFPLFAISGLAFSIAWFYIVRSYSQLNSGKFKVIHKIEEKLPLALYKAEWIALGEGLNPDLYRPLTDIEKYAPLTFAIIYVLIILITIYLFLFNNPCIFIN
jgi:hypothetical protein